jgi:hypothetical protein
MIAYRAAARLWPRCHVPYVGMAALSLKSGQVRCGCGGAKVWLWWHRGVVVADSIGPSERLSLAVHLVGCLWSPAGC